MNLKVLILKPVAYSLLSPSKASGITLILAGKCFLNTMDDGPEVSSLRKCKE